MEVQNGTILRILIVDDHELIRLMLGFELDQEPDFQVVGTAADGCSAITQAVELKPDVIIMDLQMPLMDGLTASRHIKQDLPKVPIIAYTSVLDPQVEVMTAAIPVDKFCYKNTNISMLINLIRQYKKPTSINGGNF